MARPASVLALLLVLIALMTAPIWPFEYPPLVDYPNHMARMWITLNQDDPVLSRMYGISDAYLPNLAMDLVVPPLARLVGLTLAGKLFLFATMALLLSGPLVLHFALFKRLSLVPLLAALVIYSSALHLGLLNYLAGCALAIWLFAVHVLTSRWPVHWRIVLGSAMATALLTTHIYALAVYAVLVGTHALVEAWDSDMPMGRRLGELVARAAQFALPVAVYLAFVPPFETGGGLDFTNPLGKLGSFTRLATWEGLWLKLATVALVAAVAIAAARRRIWLFHPALGPAVLVLAAWLLLMPEVTLGASNADWRIVIPLALVACGAMVDPLRGRMAAIAFSAALVALAAAQVGVIYERWLVADGYQRHMVGLFRGLEPGARIYPLIVGTSQFAAEWPIPWSNMACLAVIANSHFVPRLYAIPTQQRLFYRDSYEELRQTGGFGGIGRPDRLDWARLALDYDYVLVTDPDGRVADVIAQIPVPTVAVGPSHSHIALLEVGGQGGRP